MLLHSLLSRHSTMSSRRNDSEKELQQGTREGKIIRDPESLVINKPEQWPLGSRDHQVQNTMISLFKGRVFLFLACLDPVKGFNDKHLNFLVSSGTRQDFPLHVTVSFKPVPHFRISSWIAVRRPPCCVSLQLKPAKSRSAFSAPDWAAEGCLDISPILSSFSF